MPENDDPKQRILEVLSAQAGQGLRRSELRRAAGMSSGADAGVFRQAFKSLMSAGVVVRQRGGRYVLSNRTELVPGCFQANMRGFGFVTPDAGGADIFIPPKGIQGAISGDRVLVEITEAAAERGPVGRIRRITERTRRRMTASLVDTDIGMAVRPLRRDMPAVIALARGGHAVSPEDLEPGAWVEVVLQPQDGPDDPLSATIVRHISAPNPISALLDAICAEYDLPEPYPENKGDPPADLGCREVPRHDARAEHVITIDPLDAKDFDDGLSLLPGPAPGVMTVGVHIADVAAYVSAGGSLDLGARERAFTAYLPGRTLPMFPPHLAARECSLLAGEDRLAHSVYLDVDSASGHIVACRRLRTLIRVRDRLTFEAVGRILAGEDLAASVSTEAVSLVRRLGELAAALRKRRQAREDFLRLSVPEIRVLCSEDPPRIQGLMRVNPGPAHALVEEFMLAANTAVANEMAEKDIPTLYRNHAEPAATDLLAFADWIRQISELGVPDVTERRSLNRFLEKVATAPLGDIIASQFLRLMPRAVYETSGGGHYGLGKDLYLHFTSPIRRYPDLLVHQQLLAADLGETQRSLEECEAIGRHCNGRQEMVESAYYAAVDRLKMRYLLEREERSSERGYYDGIVVRCAGDGILVHLPEVGMMGFVSASRLPGSGYRLDRRTGVLQERRGGKSYKSGDSIFVQIRRADTVRGELLLDPLRMRV